MTTIWGMIFCRSRGPEILTMKFGSTRFRVPPGGALSPASSADRSHVSPKEDVARAMMLGETRNRLNMGLGTMATSDTLWLSISLGGAVGAALGSMAGDIANGMALGFVAGMGLAAMLTPPRNPNNA
jgi:hypothetical protein